MDCTIMVDWVPGLTIHLHVTHKPNLPIGSRLTKFIVEGIVCTSIRLHHLPNCMGSTMATNYFVGDEIWYQITLPTQLCSFVRGSTIPGIRLHHPHNSTASSVSF